MKKTCNNCKYFDVIVNLLPAFGPVMMEDSCKFSGMRPGCPCEHWEAKAKHHAVKNRTEEDDD